MEAEGEETDCEEAVAAEAEGEETEGEEAEGEEEEEEAEEDEGDKYDVELLLTKRDTKGSGTEYMVKWEGFDETTWEPLFSV